MSSNYPPHASAQMYEEWAGMTGHEEEAEPDEIGCDAWQCTETTTDPERDGWTNIEGNMFCPLCNDVLLDEAEVAE